MDAGIGEGETSKRRALMPCYALGAAALALGGIAVVWGITADIVTGLASGVAAIDETGVTGSALSSLTWLPWLCALLSGVLGELGPKLARGGDAVALSHGQWQQERARRLVLPGVAMFAASVILEGSSLFVTGVPLPSILSFLGFVAVLLAWPTLSTLWLLKLRRGLSARETEIPGDAVRGLAPENRMLATGYALPLAAVAVMAIGVSAPDSYGSRWCEHAVLALLLLATAVGLQARSDGDPVRETHAAWHRARARTLAIPSLAMLALSVPLDIAFPLKPDGGLPGGMLLGLIAMAGLLAVWPVLCAFGLQRLLNGRPVPLRRSE